MKVELKKINISKSIIDQIETAGASSILTQNEILGWCYWNIGTPSKPLKNKVILFFNGDGKIRKFIEFDSIEDTSFYSMVDIFDSTKGLKYNNQLTLWRRDMNKIQFSFEDEYSKNSLEFNLKMLERVANEKGQFFI